MRSRSLLYLALGPAAAASFGAATPLIIPEMAGSVSIRPDGQPPGQLEHPHHPPLLSGAAYGPLAGSGPGESSGQPLRKTHQG